MRTLTFFSTLIFVPFAAWAGQVQSPSLTLPYNTTQDLADVVEIFTDSYDAYRMYAFGHDEVAPASKTALDPRNGWGATIVDALSTMEIMGLTSYLSDALAFVQNVDFSKSKTPATVSVFESTIRYIGGLLSAYELGGQENQFLVDKAKQLADSLSVAWTQGNAIPYGYVNFNTSSPVKATSSIAEAGTLTLEWSRLSQYTDDNKYTELAEAAALKIMNNPAPLLGLPAQGIDPSTGKPVGGYIGCIFDSSACAAQLTAISQTWGGGSDSYFEYLIKYARLSSNTTDNRFADAWLTAVDSSIKYLKRTSTAGAHVYLADIDDQGLVRHVGSHLACFLAGNWLLGGKLADNATIVSVALQLNDACWNTYAGDATGIGPETFAYASSDGGYTGTVNDVPQNQLEFYSEHGYYISAQIIFSARRSAVKSFNKYLNTSTGFAGITDVNNINTTRDDETQSFWFAEVLKYLYLTFDDPSHISLDDYVFNTEAHPFKAPPAKSTYGSGQLQPSTTDRRHIEWRGSASPPQPYAVQDSRWT
ncbi:glycoside hydrolase family 47 protein [Lactarius quietus]|nr:glycoside hydrolase family 47 protein [Lactarius quietus]